MALKGLRLNLPYFLLHSLHKMAIMVQCTIGNQDCSLFHHGLIKMLVQYQLDTVAKTWDELLKENDFGLTQFFPTYSPKTRAKRRIPCEGEVKEETDHISDHEGLDKLCLIVGNEKFYIENPPQQSKRENEVGEESKIVVQTHSTKSTSDLYSKEIEERNKHEVKGKNLESDNKTLEPSMRKSEMFN